MLNPDMTVRIVGENPDAEVSVVGGQVIEATPADVGKVVVVGADGTLVLAGALDADGDLLTRAGGLPAGISRAELAADSAFTGAYASVVNVIGYGATGDGTTDDTTAVQAALDAAAAAGGGTVYFPPGTYMVTSLTVGDAVTLQGAGPWASEIKQIASTNAHLLTLETGSTINVGVRDLILHGNNDNQTDANDLIRFDNTAGGSTTLARHRILNVHLRSAKGNGLYLGPYSRASVVDAVDIYDADADGLVLAGSDSQVSNVSIGQSGDDGVVISGSSYQLQNVKSWYSGRLGANGRGFLIEGSRNTLTNCYSQENRAHGFMAFKSGTVITSLQLIGCISDGGGTIANQQGFNLYNCTGALVRGTVTKFTGAIGTPAEGLAIAGGSTECDVALTVNGNSGADITASSVLTGNVVRLNGLLQPSNTGWTDFTNLTTDKTCDANATTVEELADILGTLIIQLKAGGVISA